MKTYTTTQGDAWDYIALKEMGSEMHTHILLKANPDHAKTNIFSSGITLNIPDIPESTVIADNLPPWKKGK